MTGQESRRIVVGVDGSPASVRALAWAVREGRLSGGVVEVICAWQYPVGYGWAMTDADPEIRELSMETLEKAIAEAGAAAEEKVRIRLHVIEQEPVQALIEAAKEADLLVVGSRGHGGLTTMLLGSVSQRCVHHAPCPVVVVHSHEG